MATHSSILAWKIPWSLAGYRPWGCRESEKTEWAPHNTQQGRLTGPPGSEAVLPSSLSASWKHWRGTWSPEKQTGLSSCLSISRSKLQRTWSSSVYTHFQVQACLRDWQLQTLPLPSQPRGFRIEIGALCNLALGKSISSSEHCSGNGNIVSQSKPGLGQSSGFRRHPSCNSSPNVRVFLVHYFIPCEVGVRVSILEKKLKLQEGKGLACGHEVGKWPGSDLTHSPLSDLTLPSLGPLLQVPTLYRILPSWST